MEQNKITYQVHPKETLYFTLKLFTCLVLYPVLFYGLFYLFSNGISAQFGVLLFYAVIIVAFILLRLGLLIGYLKGNAIKINDRQLPDIYEIVKKQSKLLGMTNIPDVYLLQQGGLLNAFATRFMGTNYVVIYSDILEEAYENNIEAVEFIIGHELGHVKRKHITKGFLLFPSFVIPFLNSAYSRACEYTCDNIGAALSPKGARNGLIILASGKKLYKKINVQRFTSQADTEDGFWSWLAEKLSTHPKLAKRVLHVQVKEIKTITEPKPAFSATKDHSAYFPS